MCRILVVNRLEDLVTEIGSRRFLRMLATLSRDGNNHACGFAVVKRTGAVKWIRMPVPCHLVAAHLREYPNLLEEIVKDSVYGIFHARKATGGTPLVNVNNHPFCDKVTKMCLIHNGSVDPKKNIYFEKEYDHIRERIGDPETDSALLLVALVKEYEDHPGPLHRLAEKTWDGFKGKASIAVVRGPSREMLYTKNSKASIEYARIGVSDVLATSYETLRVVGARYGGTFAPNKKLEPMEYYTIENIVMYWEDGELRHVEVKELVEPGYTYTYTYSHGYKGTVYKY